MMKLFVYLLFGISMLAYVDAINKRQCQSCNNSNYPLCATNGTHWFLFKNECRLNSENLKREQNGDPILQKTEIANCFKRCDQVCTEEYAPICARTSTAQRTFQNRCHFDLENCRNGNIWMVLHEGECPPTQLPTPTSVDSECPTFCSLEYNPICATFGDMDHTFQNECYLRTDMCTTRRGWEIKHGGECEVPEPKCNEACPRIYSPMCATFNGENRTFSNECLLESEICLTGNQWCILHRGECVEPPPRQCPETCNLLYRPVCATSNGVTRTFPNQCVLDAVGCRTGENWEVINEGECAPLTSPSPPLTPPNCPDVCPTLYDPLCANFQGSQRTFPNGCELTIDVCKTGQDWQILYNGPCKEETNDSGCVNNSEDSSICPAIYAPICATFNGELRTFPNKCEMDVEISRTNQEWKVVSETECPPPSEISCPLPIIDCPKTCTLRYNPICATHQGVLRSFRNECILRAEICRTRNNWLVVNPGPCSEPIDQEITIPTLPTNQSCPSPIIDCPKTCTLHNSPVCAMHQGVSRTFRNECILRADICRTKNNWLVVNEGPCPKPNEAPPVSTNQLLPPPILPANTSCPPPSSINCPKTCTLRYSPVCAMHRGVSRTFLNECILRAEICRTKNNWLVVNQGLCPERIGVPPVTTPQELTLPPLPENPTSIIDCPKTCTLRNNPVCATHQGVSRTFRNECILRAEICRTKNNWLVVNEGPCTKPIEAPPMTPDPEPTLPTPADPLDSFPIIDCPKTCTLCNNPVCAMHQGVSRTFRNECILRAEICRTKNNWLVVNSGPCPAPTETPPVTPDQGSTVPNLPANSQMLSMFLNYFRSYFQQSNPTLIEQPPASDPLVDPVPVQPPVDLKSANNKPFRSFTQRYLVQ